MTELQFRALLGTFVVLLVAHIAYNPHREAPAEYSAWIRQLRPHRRYLLLAALLAVIGAGIAGLVGMFFFARWAAILFLVAAAMVEFIRPKERNPVEKALAYSVTGAEILLFYLVFFGPAKALFL